MMGLVDIYVSHLEKDGNFLKIYGQRDRQSAEDVERMLARCAVEFENGKYVCDPKDLHADFLCVCRFDDGSYYRAKILEVNLISGNVNCYYLDYGNRAIVHFTNLRVPSNLQALFKIPAQASSYVLTGVVGSWSPEILNSICPKILYEEVKGLVLKSVGQRSEIHLLKLFLGNADFAEILQQWKVACLIPQDRFEVMIWTHYSVASFMPLPGYQSQITGNQWPQAYNLQSNVTAVPPVAPFVQNGPNSSMPTPAPVPSAVAPVASLPGPTCNGSAARLPVDLRKKSLKEPAASFATIKLQNNTDYKVFISHIDKGTFSFYAQLLEKSDELEEMVKALNNPSAVLSILSQPLIPGKMCLAKFHEDDTIYRSIITSVGDDCCNVYFVDYGNCDTVKCHELFEIPPEYTHPMAMAIPFVVADLNKVNATDEMLAAFYSIAYEENCVLKVVPPKCEQLSAKQLGELFIDETNVKELINLEILKKKPKPKINFRNAPLPEAGSKVKVVVSFIRSVNCFFVQSVQYTKDLEDVMATVAEHCNGSARVLMDSEAQPGLACCALYAPDDTWYRGLIIKTKPIKVFYVDYGNEDEITEAGHLKVASDEVINKLATQAIPCRLDGFESEEALTSKFEELALEETFLMQAVKLDLDKEVPCVVVKLINEDGVDISELIKPSVMKAVQGRSVKSANGPTEDFIRDQQEIRQPANSASKSYSSRECQEKNVHQVNGSKSNFQSNRNPAAPVHHNKTDPNVWFAKSTSHIGHCDRVDDSLKEDSSRYSSHNSYTNSRNSPKPNALNNNVSGDTSRNDSPTPLAFSKWSIEIGSKKPVDIIYSTNPSDFYVSERNIDSDNLQELIGEHILQGGKPLPSSLKHVGSACIAKWSEDDEYYRAQILEPTCTGAKVKFIDFGNDAEVDDNDLFQMEPDLMSQKAKAIHCQLIGVPQMRTWKEDDVTRFEEFSGLNQLEAEFVNVKDNLYSVVLRDPSLQDSLNELFGATPETLLSPQSLVTCIKNKQVLDVGMEVAVEVTSFETPGRFYVQIPSSEFQNMMKSMQNVYKNKQPIQPIIGQAVVAKFIDGAFYRGEVKIEKGGKFGVQYCDYGNKSLVDPSNIFGLENQFSSLPAQAILCELGDVLPLNGQWVKDSDTKELFKGKFTCHVLEAGETSCSVRLTQKNQDLAEHLKLIGKAAGPSVVPVPEEPSAVPVPEKPSSVNALSEATPISEPHEAPGVDPQLMMGQFIQALLHLDHQSLFATFEPKALAQMQDDVTNCVAQGLVNLPPHQLSPGTLCLVLDNLDGRYQRASVIDCKSKAGISVKFLDCGRSEEIPGGLIYILPDQLKCIPALAHECVVRNIKCTNDYQQISGQRVTLFMESYENERFTCQVLDECGQPFSFAPVIDLQVAPPILPTPILKQQIGVDVIHASGSFVWLHQKKDAESIQQLLENMFESYEESGDYLTSFTCGEVCAAKSSDGDWYRAVIKESNLGADHVNVQFLDYGNTEDIPRNNLKILQGFSNIPAFAIKAELPVITEDALLGETIIEMAGEKSYIAYFARKGTEWLVELIDGKEVLSRQLILTGRALSMEKNPLPAIMRKPEVSLGVGQIHAAELSFINSLNEFFVHLRSQEDRLEKMQTDLQEIAHCMNGYTKYPSVGTKVMSLLDDVWYRGEIFPGEMVYFYDYGNCDPVDLDSLKVLPPAMEEVESLVVKCCLQAPNARKWSERAIEHFQEFLEARPFNIAVMSVYGHTYSVNVTDSTGVSIADILAAKGFLEASQCVVSESQSGQPNFASSQGSLFEGKHKVTVVFEEGPSDFYVHLNRNSEMVDKVAADLEAAEEFPDCTDSSKGKICAALASDDVWYRAQILGGQLGHTEVKFIDFGNIEETPRIKELPTQLQVTPPLALHCALREPSGLSWCQSSGELFTRLTASEDLEIELLSKEEPFTVNLWQGDVNISQKLASASGIKACGADILVTDMKVLEPLESFSSADAENNCQIVENPAKHLLLDQTESDIIHLNGQSTDNLDLVVTEEYLAKEIVCTDASSIDTEGNLLEVEDDSIIDITPLEEGIPVITLDDTTEENGHDVSIDVVTVDMGEMSEGKDDSVIEMSQLESIPVLTPNDTIDEISILEGNMSVILNGNTKERASEVVLIQDNDACADKLVKSNCVTDSIGQLGDQNSFSTSLAPKIGIPDSSTVDIDLNTEDFLLTRTLGNNQADPRDVLVSSESDSTANISLTSKSNENLTEKPVEIQENCSAHDEEDGVPPSVSSSTEEKHTEEICDMIAETKDCCIPAVSEIDTLVKVFTESCVLEQKTCALEAGADAHHIPQDKDSSVVELEESVKESIENNEICSPDKTCALRDGSNLQHTSQADISNSSDAKEIVLSERNLTETLISENSNVEQICTESCASDRVQGKSETISPRMEEDCDKISTDHCNSQLSVISEMDESIDESTENEDSCAEKEMQAPMDEGNSSHLKMKMNPQNQESEMVVTLSTYPDWKSCELDINGIDHGQSVARRQDFLRDFLQGIPGTRIYTFEDCDQHLSTVEISTTPTEDNFSRETHRKSKKNLTSISVID